MNNEIKTPMDWPSTPGSIAAAITHNLDKSRKARRQRFRSKVVGAILTTPETLPQLQKPKRGKPSTIRNYTYLCGQMNWNKRDWWRFKRACYAEGMNAREVMRILCQQYAEDYEATRDDAA